MPYWNNMNGPKLLRATRCGSRQWLLIKLLEVGQSAFYHDDDLRHYSMPVNNIKRVAYYYSIRLRRSYSTKRTAKGFKIKREA